MAKKLRITSKQKSARRKNIAVARKSKKRSTATAGVVAKVKKSHKKEYASTKGMGKSNKRAQLALLIKGMK